MTGRKKQESNPKNTHDFDGTIFSSNLSGQ